MITNDFLIKPFKLGIPRANNGTDSDVYTTIINEVEYCIDLYERNYLKVILGEDLYAEYINDMAVPETAAKWADFNAKLIVDDKAYISPIANYIFYHYVKRNNVRYIDDQFQINKIEGATILNTEIEINKIWNEMVAMNETFLAWLIYNVPETTAKLNYYMWTYLTTTKSSIAWS